MSFDLPLNHGDPQPGGIRPGPDTGHTRSNDGRTLLNRAELMAWRNEIAADVQDAEYELAKAQAMLAWIDAEIRKLETP